MKLFFFQGGGRYTPLPLTPSQCQRGKAPLDSQVLFVLLTFYKGVIFNFAHKGRAKVLRAQNFDCKKLSAMLGLGSSIGCCLRFRAMSRVLLKSRSNLSNHPAPLQRSKRLLVRFVKRSVNPRRLILKII